MCHRERSTPEYKGTEIEVAGRFKKWPDILSGMDAVIMSENVVNVITGHDFTGFVAHPVKIAARRETGFWPKPAPPPYFLLEIVGRVDVDTRDLEDSLCLGCRCYIKLPRPKPYLLNLETWDGGLFVKAGNLRTGHTYCARQFVELAHTHRWSNFFFGESMPGVGLWEVPPKGKISYLDADWLPKVCARLQAHPDFSG